MTLSRAESKRQFIERQAWIDGVQASRDLSPTARLIGGRIGMHKNLETGQCNPGAGTLAAEAGVAERSAFRAIAELERKGRIEIERTRGGAQNNSNSYRLIPQIEAATGDKVSGVSPPVRGDNHDMSGVTICQANIEENNKSPSLASAKLERDGGESDAPSVRESPGAAGARLDGAAAAQAAGAAVGAGSKQDSPIESPVTGRESEKVLVTKKMVREPSGDRTPPPKASRERVSLRDFVAPAPDIAPPEHAATSEGVEIIPPSDIATGFAVLRERWRRGWAADDTARAIAIQRNAYRRACATAEPGEIMAGAERAIAGADAPRFLPELAGWLDARGWTKPPPTKTKRRGGNGPRRRDDGLPRTNGYRVDMAQVMFELGAEQ